MKTNNGTINERTSFTTPVEARVLRAPPDDTPAWIREQDNKEREAKDIIGGYVAKHLISFGAFLLIGPGTSPNAVMRKWIEIQKHTGSPQDLEILTTNLEIMGLGNRARLEAFRLFEGLRITLAGGLVSPSMNCLVGSIAANSILAKNVHPSVVLLGVHGLDFSDGDIRLIYRYSDELSSQMAYAVRATCRRVLVCDATKLGRKIGYDIDVKVENLLAEADECIIVTNRPSDADVARRFNEQIRAFEKLLATLHESNRFLDKNFALRVLSPGGGVEVEFSLKVLREHAKAPADSPHSVDPMLVANRAYDHDRDEKMCIRIQ